MAWPLPVLAQQPVPLIGYLGAQSGWRYMPCGASPAFDCWRQCDDEFQETSRVEVRFTQNQESDHDSNRTR